MRDNARHDRALKAAAYRAISMLLIISDLKFRPFKAKMPLGWRKGLELQQEPLDETISIDQSRAARTHH